MNHDRPAVSVVTPVYRAEGCLEELHSRLIAVLDVAVGDDGWEVIYVDDRSPDASWERLVEVAARDPRARITRLSRNFGQEAATSAGLELARAPWIVTMDCDLQDRPEDIPRLLDAAGPDALVVRAVRDKSGASHRVLGTRLYFWLLNRIAGSNIDWREAAFGVMHESVASAYVGLGDVNRNMLMVLDWLGFSTRQVRVAHDARFEGESAYTLRTLFKYAASGVFFHTTKPLRWIVLIGFLFAAASAVGSVLIAVDRLTGAPTYPGWASLMVAASAVSGVTITTVGITGLYIARIFEQVRGRPRYIHEPLAVEAPRITRARAGVTEDRC